MDKGEREKGERKQREKGRQRDRDAGRQRHREMMERHTEREGWAER